MHCEGRLVGDLPRLPLEWPGYANLVGDVLEFIGGIPHGVVGEDRGGKGWESRKGPAAKRSHRATHYLLMVPLAS